MNADEMTVAELETLIDQKSRDADAAWKTAKAELRELNAVRDRKAAVDKIEGVLKSLSPAEKTALAQAIAVKKTDSAATVHAAGS